MLKTTESTGSVASPKKTEGEVGDDNVVNVVGGGEATNPTKEKIWQK